ncbi:MAG: glycosyl transferase group 1 [Chloroflexi bacterium]|nr:glycosyl transferase group 1 [Chloroflexota bacterium]
MTVDVGFHERVGIGNLKAARILWLTPYVPAPNFGGGSRVFNLMRSLARSWTIDAIVCDGGSNESIGPLQAICRHVELVPTVAHSTWHRRHRQLMAMLSKHSLLYWTHYAPDARRCMERMLADNKYDVVILEHAFMGYYRVLSQVPVVLDQHNVESTLMLSASRHERTLIRRLYNALEYRKFLPEEQQICRSTNLILTTSLPDRRLIERWGDTAPVKVIPNGVDSTHFAPASFAHRAVNEFGVVFTGTMHYAPNAEAMLFFCKDIWPRILAQVPSATLRIVGGNPPPAIRRLGQVPGVEVVGYVEDLRPYIAEAAISIAPLHMGSGTRLKILEAMAMGRAVVSTTVGCEGLEVEDGKHLLVADEPSAFADQVVALLRNPTRRADIGLEARRLIEDRYDWSAIGMDLDHALRSALIRT